jgi:sRNA-binding protein
MMLLDLQKTVNVFTDGANHLTKHAGLSAARAEDAIREFCQDYSQLEEHFQRVPREGGTCGGNSPVAEADHAASHAAAHAAALAATGGAGAVQAAAEPRAKFFVAIDSWGQVLSLHSTQKAAVRRGKTYDGYTVLELELDGKDQCTDDSSDEEPAPKRGRTSVQ